MNGEPALSKVSLGVEIPCGNSRPRLSVERISTAIGPETENFVAGPSR